MNERKIYIETDPTEEELLAIEQAIEILSEAGLELIGTRPKRR